MKKYLWLAPLCLIGVAVGTWQLNGQTQAQGKDVKLKQFMHQKLDHAKAILEGLVTEDTDKIASSAQSLSLLSLESSWNVITTEKYLQNSMAFRRAADAIHKAAKEKNIDRATLSYVDLTMRCVECHKYIREKQAPNQSINIDSSPSKPK